MKSCKEAGNKLQAGKSAAASWKKFVQMCQKVCTIYGTSQVHCVEKVCTKVQKMRKLAKHKIVQMCENARNICIKVQKIRKLIEKNARKCVKNTRKCVIFNQ